MIFLRRNTAGFTLIEILIVIAILGILASIAIPSYTQYVQRTKVAGAATAIASWQTSVEQCILNRGKLGGCDANEGSIPDNIEDPGTKFVKSLTVKDGVIKVITTGVTSDNKEMTLNYTPDIVQGYVEWSLTGTGCSSDPASKGRGIDCDFN